MEYVIIDNEPYLVTENSMAPVIPLESMEEIKSILEASERELELAVSRRSELVSGIDSHSGWRGYMRRRGLARELREVERCISCMEERLTEYEERCSCWEEIMKEI